MKYFNIYFVSFFFLFMYMILNFFLFIYFIMNDLVIFLEWELVSLNSSVFLFSVLLDWMSFLFMMFVSLISSVVIYYSKSYMKSEKNFFRFILLVLLFVLSMMLLIISPNLISILLGWDGLGLVSYCLVIFYQNFKSFNAGMLTFLSNRIGDVLILLSISWMLNYGSWNYIFYMNFMKNDFSMMFVMFLIVVASMTKSAQIPYSSWLPAAMAAPTPVSALVHSSTLVTAGVYLLIRFSSLLNNSIFFKFLLLVSSLTMLMSGLSANNEFDLKKIIALSTLSQLGMMMSILSLGLSELAFFHLLTHAMFKALLFMCAGVLIHMMMDIQDIRFMGGLVNYIPMTTMFFNFSNLSLCGIPFLSGFYSKDLIMEMMSMYNMNFFIYFIYYFCIGLTVCYTIRLVFYLMINTNNLLSIYNLFDEDYVMLKSMIMLFVMTLISGSMLSWLLFTKPYMIFLPLNMKFMVFYFMIIGGFIGYYISFMKIKSLNKFIYLYNIMNFFSLMLFMPNLFTYGMNYIFLNLSNLLMKNIDYGWSEIYSGYGMSKIVKNYSMIYQIFQMNNLKIYLFSFILWMMILFMMFLLN
nr:NADH dehydrogenase subunit 5 [Stomphastis sp.]UYL25736.1 NADH dehydrogenase subunit 5 [Stomphastis sp.]UYL25749.1 NADH dehydrogenase subunit 5 [Stomphastis sp.]UYL25762.1 NADH dehydrogenase subunit 5 [Stomphastis sp.]UYL25775.1 NADH dehydrogenase subunit 5 [Stomphastis sp.]